MSIGPLKMSDLEEAVWQRMVEFGDETFSFVDFVPNFSTGDKKYEIAYGTFRNIISKLLQARMDSSCVLFSSGLLLHNKI